MPSLPAACARPRPRRALRSQVPLSMALWGFGLVAVWEITLFLLRGEPPAAGAKKQPAPPDEAELLLEELMRQADAAQTGPDGAGTPRPQTPGAVS